MKLRLDIFRMLIALAALPFCIVFGILVCLKNGGPRFVLFALLSIAVCGCCTTKSDSNEYLPPVKYSSLN